MKSIKPTVSKLAKEEHYGDWHDKPVRYIVTLGEHDQKFSTKKDAVRFAGMWHRTGDLLEAINLFRDDFIKH